MAFCHHNYYNHQYYRHYHRHHSYEYQCYCYRHFYRYRYLYTLGIVLWLTEFLEKKLDPGIVLWLQNESVRGVWKCIIEIVLHWLHNSLLLSFYIDVIYILTNVPILWNLIQHAYISSKDALKLFRSRNFSSTYSVQNGNKSTLLVAFCPMFLSWVRNSVYILFFRNISCPLAEITLRPLANETWHSI